MKSILRKVTSICIATAMVAAMGLTSLADENIGGNGTVLGNKDPADALEKTLVIEKELTAYNAETTSIYAPNISYSYTATGVSGKTVTDSDGVSAVTKAGVTTGLTITGVAWTDAEQINASSTGVANRKDITIDFSGVDFPGAGVYRYQIAETCSPTKAVAGVTDGTIADSRYLDVYVRDPRTGESGDIIYGYVLFENNNDIDGRASATTNTVDDANKTEGFVAISGTGTTLSADSYYTYNVSVTKRLVNDAGNATNAFPFELTFTRANGTDFALVKAETAGTSSADMSALVTTAIKDGDTTTFYGIPCGTTVDIVEENNVSTAAYSVTTSGDADVNITTAVIRNYGEKTGATAVQINSTAADTAVAATKAVTFQNELALISPTGVAMAVLPFVIMLVFGLGFMAVATKKKADEQA